MAASDSSILFSAAWLTQARNLTDRQRAQIISKVPDQTSGDFPDLAAWLTHACGSSAKTTARKTERARRLADEWARQGVSVVRTDALLAGKPSAAEELPPVLLLWGQGRGLQQPAAAILNSRKTRRLAPEDRWVDVTREMFERAGRQGLAILSSLGNYPYDLVTVLAKNEGLELVVLLDGPLPPMTSPDQAEAFLHQYKDFFNPARTIFLSPFTPGRLPPVKERGLVRDQCLAGLAEVIFVAEIRTGGNMETLAARALEDGRPVQVFEPNRFDAAVGGNCSLKELGAKAIRIAASSRKTSSHSWKKVNLQFRDLSTILGRDYLVHFTRSCPGPWPGQSLFEFYQYLLAGTEGAAHTALDTLRRILEEGLIRGSRRLVRGGIKAVSFTSGDLPDLGSLMKWRPGLVRPTWEPYGLALPRDVLESLGAAPVIYGGEEDWKRLPDQDKFRFQLHRPPHTDWTGENEWRLPGDLDLNLVLQNRMRILVPQTHEAEELVRRYRDISIVVMGLENQV